MTTGSNSGGRPYADGQNSDRPGVLEAEKRFTEDMIKSRTTGEPAETVLKTDDRVLARITDGIYRQPSSALRELISNAYDADATEVFIETDSPRYSQIEVRDNGIGMDEEALSRLIHHIGGSTKRTSLGKDMGTTAADNAGLSPAGRKLIGKIGIGLFSVSQLTSHFQIITKRKGADHRLFADVILRTYLEDEEEAAADRPFETGTVRVVSVPAEDIKAHGTQIILRQIHPRARNILRSRERWESYYEQLELPEKDRDPAVTAPVFHSGNLAQEPDPDDKQLVFQDGPAMPWKDIAKPTPLQKFEALRTALAGQVGSASDRPEVARTFDNYLALLWTLSLSAPVPYLDGHPFDLTSLDDPVAFMITNARGQAQKLDLEGGQKIREAAGLTAHDTAAGGGFKVFVDAIELRRPITFEWWPSERQAVQHPMMFVGKYTPDLSKVPASIRGGELSFEAYLFWNSKIVPKENNGVLVRINGASGALFDDTFMKYQVSEQTRLRQITAEIFVSKGLDAALNIDRESFNFAHPHYALVSKWLHRALRQVANTQKAVSGAIREAEAEVRQEETGARLGQYASDAWRAARRESTERPPPVEMASNAAAAAERRQQGVIAFDRSKLSAVKPVAGKARDVTEREQKLKAIATILDGFGIFDNMAYEDQHRLMNAILAVFFDDGKR
ncbi:ATP-binding protein [Agaricicola taiwanensis]|uniref:ATP-binding protein n=1 Tax=Agaricicola taiwanensis TaxID=591372 RepID=A0A8J2YMF5_9RHOB|nr:ATP-binding protein [Agaricicola taiwanensis]GGE53112.1 ATP-binding protein [Agaricicola taiwanensis]